MSTGIVEITRPSRMTERHQIPDTGRSLPFQKSLRRRQSQLVNALVVKEYVTYLQMIYMRKGAHRVWACSRKSDANDDRTDIFDP
jgi:hypothetical protein